MTTTKAPEYQSYKTFLSPFRPGACTIKHYGLVMYGFCSKPSEFVSKPIKPLTITTTLTYYVRRPFYVHYESVMFYSIDP
jgi:hypothetical protein